MCEHMTELAMQSMGRDPQLLSSRLKQFVAPISAKELSRRVGCDLRTAENIKAGHWPIARHWLGLFQTFRDDLIEAVFYPEQAAARLEREVSDLEEQLAQKRAELRHLSGHRSCLAEVKAAHEGRPLSQPIAFDGRGGQP